MRGMKDSGIEWIGEIPEEWIIVRTKNEYHFHKNIVGDQADAYQRLALTLNGVIKRSKEDSNGLQPEAFTGYQILNEGELVFKLIDLENVSTSRVGYSPYVGLVSPAYIVLAPKQKVNSKFGEYYFLSMWQREVFNHMGDDGVRSSLNSNDLLNIPYIRMGYEEQTKIAHFLDEQCVELNSILSKTRTSIDEYKKLKQAIITQAVTKGVRGDRKMKDSGVGWIGEIPKEWNCAQLGKFITIQSGISVGKSYPKDAELVEVPYLRVANVQGDYVDTSDIAMLLVTPSEAEKYRLHVGQLLMTEGGDRDKLGRGCLWNGEIDPCIHQNHIFAVETNELLDIEYLDYITTSNVARVYFDITAKKTTNLACTNKSTILKFIIPVPTIDEQIEIKRYLNVECPKIDSIIEKKEAYIMELDNYRKALIYEYVTGKKEVP